MSNCSIKLITPVNQFRFNNALSKGKTKANELSMTEFAGFDIKKDGEEIHQPNRQPNHESYAN